MFKVVILFSAIMNVQQAMSLLIMRSSPAVTMAMNSAINVPVELRFELPKQRGSKKTTVNQISSPASYDQLMVWLRAQSETYRADLEVFANGELVHDNASFSSLNTSTVHQLKVKSLSREFKSYKNLKVVMKYAQVGSIEQSAEWFDDQTLAPFCWFDDHHDHVYSHIVDLISVSAIKSTSNKMLVRSVIFKVCVKAALLANRELENQRFREDPTSYLSSAPSPSNKSTVEDEVTVKGKRAHGVLDFVMNIERTILPLLCAQNQLAKAVCQALAQLVAVREQTLHYYAQQYVNIPEAKIKAAMDEFPSFGVVSTGVDWRLLKYQWEPLTHSWRAFKSPVFKLNFPTSVKEKNELLGQIEILVTRIAYVALLQQQNALTLQDKLGALSGSYCSL